MSTIIRFTRVGKKNAPLYRAVVTEKDNARDGKFIEVLGTYNPTVQDDSKKMVLNMDKYNSWVKKGAEVSDTIKTLLKKLPVTK